MEVNLAGFNFYIITTTTTTTTTTTKVKVKLSLCLTKHHAMTAYWGSEGIAPRMLWPRHWMEVSGQLHALAALSPGKETLVPIG
jgi:hypothetical protein